MTRLKLLASVSTLAVGLALSGSAFALADDNAVGLGNASDGSNAATLSHQANGNEANSNTIGSSNPDSSQHNQTGAGDASTGGKNIASNNSLSNVGNTANPDSSTHSSSAGTNTGYGDASNGGKNIASNNSLALDNNNDQSKTIDKSKGDNSGTGDASNGGKVEHSNNSDSSSRGDNSGTGNASNGGSVLASNNSLTSSGNDSSTHTKTTTIDFRAAVSNETLTGSVSGVFTAMGNATLIHGSNGATQTGNITGGTINGFAGIQTATNNTGIASLNQAATSIAANANVTFGNATP